DGHVTGVQTCALPISTIYVNGLEVSNLRGGGNGIASGNMQVSISGGLIYLYANDFIELYCWQGSANTCTLGGITGPGGDNCSLRSEERRVGKECKIK